MIYFFISGISIAVFLFLILLSKPNKQSPDYILAFLLLFGAQTIANTFLIQTDLYLKAPNLFVFSLTSPVMIGPLLFLYVKYQTRDSSFNLKDTLHFLPYFFISVLYVRFYFLSPEEKEAVFKENGKGFKLVGYLNIAYIYISGIIYSSWSLWMIVGFKRKIKHQFSNTERIQFNWLLFLIVGIIGIWSVLLIFKQNNIIALTSTCFILILGYFGIIQVNVFQQEREVIEQTNIHLNEPEQQRVYDRPKQIIDLRYQHSSLSDEEAIHIHSQLKDILQKEKPYLNPELTLKDLAQLVGKHPNKVSEVINRYEEKTFYDLINELRIQEFLTKLKLPGSTQYTFTSLAYDCGFNSKASFNRNFKKYMGKTPSEYAKNFDTKNQE